MYHVCNMIQVNPETEINLVCNMYHLMKDRLPKEDLLAIFFLCFSRCKGIIYLFPVMFYSLSSRLFCIGIFTPNDELAKEILTASEVTGEKLWRMPMEESYWESMKSGVADMVNTGGRQGGAITAALFLKQVNYFTQFPLAFRVNMSTTRPIACHVHVYESIKNSLWIGGVVGLLQFVDEKVQWVHIDMAGPVWNEKKLAATGFGVSTLVEWVVKNSS